MKFKASVVETKYRLSAINDKPLNYLSDVMVSLNCDEYGAQFADAVLAGAGYGFGKTQEEAIADLVTIILNSKNKDVVKYLNILGVKKDE